MTGQPLIRSSGASASLCVGLYYTEKPVQKVAQSAALRNASAHPYRDRMEQPLNCASA